MSPCIGVCKLDDTFDWNNQTLDDFQPLCNHCNLQKRQVCKDTIRNGTRYSALNIPSVAIWGIDFIEGDKTLDVNDINAMTGTYWHDPIAFMNHIKKNIYNK